MKLETTWIKKQHNWVRDHIQKKEITIYTQNDKILFLVYVGGCDTLF